MPGVWVTDKWKWKIEVLKNRQWRTSVRSGYLECLLWMTVTRALLSQWQYVCPLDQTSPHNAASSMIHVHWLLGCYFSVLPGLRSLEFQPGGDFGSILTANEWTQGIQVEKTWRWQRWEATIHRSSDVADTCTIPDLSGIQHLKWRQWNWLWICKSRDKGCIRTYGPSISSRFNETGQQANTMTLFGVNSASGLQVKKVLPKPNCLQGQTDKKVLLLLLSWLSLRGEG